MEDPLRPNLEEGVDMGEAVDMAVAKNTSVPDTGEDLVMEEDMVVVTVAAGDMMTTREVLCPMEVMRVRRLIQNLRVHLDLRVPTIDVRRPKRLCL